MDEETGSYEPFRIDKYHNKGKEDEIACEGVSVCCLCVAAAQIMKPMSEINLIREEVVSQEDLIDQ